MKSEKTMGFIEGERVRIKVGPFSGFTGHVAGINELQRRLKVTVDLFGQRSTVEVFFLDVEKA